MFIRNKNIKVLLGIYFYHIQILLIFYYKIIEIAQLVRTKDIQMRVVIVHRYNIFNYI